MSKKTILIVIGVILAVAAFFIFTPQAPESSAEPSNHVWSEGSSGIVLIEYGDFQCPACRSYYPALKEVKEKYKDLVTFQFRHFPLEAIHKNARAGSRAAEAAGLQGKFWEMHDYLYDNQMSWQDTDDPLGVFAGYASIIGVEDIEKFKNDYRSSEVNAVISADLDAGRKVGATSTPTFVLDGKKLEENPSPSLESFSEILDELIEEKTGQKPEFPDATAPEESDTEATEE